MLNKCSTIRVRVFTLIIFSMAIGVTPGTCALYSFEFESITSDALGTHTISGVVDTLADTMTLTTWAVSGGSTDHYIVALPNTYRAMDGTGNTYNVPDAWDGTIGNTWAFLPDDDNDGRA